MKRVRLFVIIIFAAIFAPFIQADTQSTSSENLIYIEIPQKMKICDKIFMRNKSPYTIIQSAVVWVDDKGVKHVLGTTGTIVPGGKAEVASFDDEWLKNLRGKCIGVKIKGIKKALDQVKEKDDVTYDFNVSIFEDDHDLYIDAHNVGGALDF